MSEQTKDGMGAAEAKLTELVALVSQLQTGWKFIVDYHRARLRKTKPVLSLVGSTVGWEGTTTFVLLQHMLCRSDFISPWWDPKRSRNVTSSRSKRSFASPRTNRSSPMDEHRAQGLETSKPVGATSHSGSDVHPKNQEGAAADLVTHTTKAAGEVVEHAKAAAEEIIDHAKSTAGEALTSMAEDVARQAPEIAQRVRDQAA